MPGFEAMPAGNAIELLGSDVGSGLTSREAQARLAKHGRNEIGTREKKAALSILLSQFASPIVLILVFASLVSAAIASYTEAIVIAGILVVSAVLGFVQEYRSERTLEKLSKLVVFRAKVFRDGVKLELEAGGLVPGDIVSFETGDVVPADVRIVSETALSVNQSILTGESAPVQKTSGPLPKPASSPQEMSSMAFMGTSVASGTGAGVVVATGRETELGRAAGYLKESAPETDFEKSIKSFGRMLVAVILLMCFFIFVVNAYLGKGVFESLIFALAIAVGIAPELLPAIITISLSNGATVLAKKKVVVKRLDSIEDLGNMDVLCMDKTGTLTENAMALKGHENASRAEDEGVLFKAMLASPVAVGRRHKYTGMSIDSAIWRHAQSLKLEKKAAGQKMAAEVAFDYERRMMSVILAGEGGALMVSKGSPESIIPRCTRIRIEGKDGPVSGRVNGLMRRYEELSAQGFRVIAVAEKRVELKAEYSPSDEEGLSFLGFLLFSDPPRKTAHESLHRLRALGVAVKILSGDEPHVTAAICKAVGLEVKTGKVVTGSELAGFSDWEFKKAAEEANVFARLTPVQKLRIVEALKANNHVVGFIGDGVNDAPALHSADCGISVDTGTDIAKESADIILLKHGLSVVADGITEGRKTFANTVKYIKNTISANFGNMFTVSIASVFLPFIPILPSQILLNNFVSDIPMTTVSTDRVDESDLKMPRRWHISNIAKFMVFFGLVSSVFDLVTMAFLIYFINHGFSLSELRLELSLDAAGEKLFRTGWFIESVASEILIVFAIRTAKPFFMSRPSLLLLSSSALAIAGAVLILYSPLAPWFEFAQPSLAFLAVIGGILAAYFVVAEISKHVFYHFVKA